MPAIRALGVYCGSSGAVAPAYREAASALGAGLAACGIEIVFGGGRVGLMGLLADAALAAGGRVTGVIPARLRDAELAHPGVSELLVVAGMHERKALMAERADAFAVLPGGVGTLDEMFEMLSWRQLGLHDKPIFLVDVDGYWATLISLIDEIIKRGFARPQLRGLFRVVPSIADLLRALAETPGAGGGVRGI
ncbi:MAG TPA: TIGR00730 family Rossman fold protein [Stellaceae bacterium]|nr:TIGR00730 family Rossman fold protein [Stellaceae bacterium]